MGSTNAVSSSPSGSAVKFPFAVSSGGAAVAVLALTSTSSACAQSAPAMGSPAAVAARSIEAAITEASHRFGVPAPWIRSVVRVESAGNSRAVSHAGAMGLMQVMPGTYAELRRRYGLGADPYAVRNNVLAGTAYLREMYDRYGAPGFVAAYNAGPDRWEKYVSGARSLPKETVNYLARLGPMLGFGVRPSPTARREYASPSPPIVPILIAVQDDLGAAPIGRGATIARVSAPRAAQVASGGPLFISRQTTHDGSITTSRSAPATAAAATLFAPGARLAGPSAHPTNALFVPRYSDAKE